MQRNVHTEHNTVVLQLHTDICCRCGTAALFQKKKNNIEKIIFQMRFIDCFFRTAHLYYTIANFTPEGGYFENKSSHIICHHNAYSACVCKL